MKAAQREEPRRYREDRGAAAWPAATRDCKSNRRGSLAWGVRGESRTPAETVRFCRVPQQKVEPDRISNPRFNRWGTKGCYYTAKPLSALKLERIETA